MRRDAAVLVVVSGCLLAMGTRAAAQPVGSAFQVNTFTTGLQGAPALGSAANGGFVIVWESFGQDGDDIGVFGQRYDANGVKQFGEFQANVYTSGPQAAPDIGVAGDGSFVVVWQGYGGEPDSDNGDVFARRFPAAGGMPGAEFQVNVNDAAAPSYEGAAAIAATTSGFVVVWDDYEDVFARRLDSAGAPLGAPFPVNTTTTGFQGSADVAGTADGGFVIAWEDGYFAGDGADGAGYGVFAQRFDAAGNTAGGEFQINTTTLGDQYAVSLAPSAGGGFVVVWQSYAHDGADSAVFGQRFGAAGAKLGGEFRANPSPSDYGEQPRVASDQTGDFVVVWSAPPPPTAPGSATPPSLTPSPTPIPILARRYDASGTPIGSLGVVNGGNNNQFEPAVAAAPDGRYVVAWRRDSGDVSEAAVFAQRFAAINPPPVPTSTPTATVPPTATRTATRTGTATASATATSTPTPSITRTFTRTATAISSSTPTASTTLTRTPTATSSATASATQTLPPTATRSSSATRTASATPSPTPSASGTRTGTATRTATFTATAVATSTATAPPTPTNTATPTRSATLTVTPSATPSGTATPPASATASPTRTASFTATASASATPPASPTASLTPSATPTHTASAAPTDTATSLPSASATHSATATAPPTGTSPATATATARATDTSTALPSPTPSASPTHTLAPTQTPSPTATTTSTAAPSDTATSTPTASASATVTAPEATPTASAATATVSPTCAGDCDGDGAVSVSELITAVNIALDSRAPTACPAIDTNANGQVTVDELVRAVANALNGCA